MGYEYVVEYKKGAENQAADSLSRLIEIQLMSVSIPQADWWSKLQAKVATDPFYANLKTTPPTDTFFQRDGIWFRKGRIYLNPTSSFDPDILF